MSADKQKNEGESLFQSNWHKCPNAIIDRISGSSISPSAVLVVLTVIRYTEGISSRKVAAIPTATFKRVLGTKRDNTVYRYINEAIESGLIHCSKKQGCVSSYSINENCELWSKNIPLSESATTNEKRLIPLSESDSTPKPKSDSTPKPKSDSTPKPKSDRGPLSESATLIKTSKDSIKENIKDSVNAHEKDEEPAKKKKPLDIPFDVFWKTYAKSVAKDKCEAKWESLSDKVREQIMQHLPAYVASTPVKKFRKDPMTYLNRKGWLDDIIIDEPGINQQSKPSYSSMNVNAKYEDPNYDPLDGLSSRTGAPHGNH